MNPNYKAFTLKGDRILRTLITQCGVSIPFNPLEGEVPKPIINFNALWDTGASGTVVSKNVVDKLGLKPVGKAKSFHANGESEVNVYFLNIYLPNQVMFQFVRVTEGILNGFDILVGMDIITMGDFSISNVGGKTTFSFRFPSIKHIDFVEEHTKTDGK